MHHVTIKICGIQNEDSAKTAFDLGADCLGFIFAGGSRKVTPDQVRAILNSLRSSGPFVGVFMNQSPAEVSEIARLSGITHLQLHGNEVPSEFRHIGLPILKAVPVTPEGVVGPSILNGSDYALLDTRIPGRHGGTGTAFDWDHARSSVPQLPFFVAGGLNPSNVRNAIASLLPYGVDVCSGVESNGVKNPDLIARFINEIRR